MKNRTRLAAVSAVAFGLLVLLVCPAVASAGSTGCHAVNGTGPGYQKDPGISGMPGLLRDPSQAPPDRSDRMTGMLDRLTAEGYDVSAIRAAAESGDTGTAHTLMQQFMAEHTDAFPAPPGGGGGGNRSQDTNGFSRPPSNSTATT
jgi:hypothetical protein